MFRALYYISVCDDSYITATSMTKELSFLEDGKVSSAGKSFS
jgi:hypothetical protein